MTFEPLSTLIGPDGQMPGLVQMCWRAALILLLGLAIVRLAGKRLFGQWGAIDIVISVVIGSNLSRALTGNAPFVATIVATALLVLIHMALTHMAAHLPWLGALLKGHPRRLVADGEVDASAMRRSGLGQHDLIEALRESGVARPEQAAEAWLERNGKISVLKR